MDVDAEAVGAIAVELSRVDVAVGVKEVATAFGHAVAPVALVLGAVGPVLGAFAVLDPDLFIAGSFFDSLHLTAI